MAAYMVCNNIFNSIMKLVGTCPAVGTSCCRLRSRRPYKLPCMMHKRTVHLGILRAHGRVSQEQQHYFICPFFLLCLTDWVTCLIMMKPLVLNTASKCQKSFQVVIHTLMEEVIQFSICKEQTPCSVHNSCMYSEPIRNKVS